MIFDTDIEIPLLIIAIPLLISIYIAIGAVIVDTLDLDWNAEAPLPQAMTMFWPVVVLCFPTQWALRWSRRRRARKGSELPKAQVRR